jgi:hypothetical protein
MSIPAYPTGPQGPATHVFAITPSDSVALDPIPKAIRADEAGAITFRVKDSAADVTMNFAAGEYFVGFVTHVRDTGTDAITIHGIC